VRGRECNHDNANDERRQDLKHGADIVEAALFRE
jgi:hypothetical protein